MMQPTERIDRALCRASALELAPLLLGATLARRTEDGVVRSRIVETEAYGGAEDKGCHAFGNRRTQRTEVMFHDGGTSYVYMIYGMYYCLNVVAAQQDEPQVVLIRAVEPLTLADEQWMRQHRSIKSRKPADLCNGPGKLCQALSIDKAFNGINLLVSEELWLEAGAWPGEERIVCAPRINIPYAEEYADKPWRYYIADSAHVSVKDKNAIPFTW
ncbi:DNA-3-methyladenine glycosylase [Paenibacillus sp. 481]|nr:DNA-3-methyladenine glycosylase [Paenibacillus sp. 481]UHA75937.1 DNA-3-methyladenine glycosylase [Paenibacillus sp. 481]